MVQELINLRLMSSSPEKPGNLLTCSLSAQGDVATIGTHAFAFRPMRSLVRKWPDESPVIS
jgi:hypothetical protein